MDFKDFFNKHDFILTEGSIIELLKRIYNIELDPHILNAAMLLDSKQRKYLENIYRQYLDIGHEYNLPILTLTPTWRTNPERIKWAGIDDSIDINAQAVKFLKETRNSYGDYASKIAIGALMGVKNDAYKPEEALTSDEAEEFHAWQIDKLTSADPDFFIVSTIPSRTEAIGLARALAKSEKEYILSFVVNPDGCLLDGNKIENVIEEIDNSSEVRPLTYMINCVHSDKFESSMARVSHEAPHLVDRITGLQANTSALSPEELDKLDHLDTMSGEDFGYKMSSLTKLNSCKMLGGCCGTGPEHIKALADSYFQLLKHK